jgi:predicted RNA-binding Zn-ribbon protein involved in translation (DUF1610 family)
MHAREEQLELRCSACGWSERCDLAQMRTALVRAGMLRRATDPEPSLVQELFRQSAGKFSCPECDAALTVREVDDADWGAEVKCEGCQLPIPAARLAAAPGATLCAACQQRVDRGEPVGPAEYCSHCGGIMVLKRATKGIARYVERCSECGR